jgi:anti-sigma factor RsiW
MSGPLPGHAGDLLSALLDDELDPAQQAAVGAHLRTCPNCAAEFERVTTAREAIRALPWLDLPRPVVVRMRGRRRRLLAPAAFVSAAAVSFVLFNVVAADRHVTPPVTTFVLSSAVQNTSGAAPAPSAENKAPAALAHGYERVGAWRADDYVQVVYSDGFRALSVFEQPGRLSAERLPVRGDIVPVGAGQGRELDWQGEWLVVWQSGPTTYTVVCAGGRQEALDVARSVPPEGRPPVWQRAKKAARRLLEEVSGSR